MIRNHNAPSTLNTDKLQVIRRALSTVRIYERDRVVKSSTSLDKSWDGAILFSYETEEEVKEGNVSVTASVEITCTTCYIKGTATAQLTVDGSFNASQAFHNTVSEVEGEISNITSSAIDYAESYFESVAKNLSDLSTFKFSDLDFPTIPFNFNVDLQDVPQCQLRFEFDGMELYMLLDTILSVGATYTLNLYSSETPIGIHDENLEVGVIFSIDLILSVDAQIDISSGFHIKLEDGVAIDIAMFGKDISSITFNGGQFEFLPVTLESDSVILKAVLRVGVHAGLEIASPSFSFPPVLNFSVPTASAGVDVGIFANIAEFVTNVTVAEPGDSCELRVVQSYQLALGAAAGASLAVGSHTWGPTPNTTVPIWYTTLADVCAMRGHSTATTATTVTTVTAGGEVQKRDLTTTTISTPVVYTGINCMSSGLVNCPASLQTTSQFTTIKTLITAVPSGSVASFPATTQNTVLNTVAFGSNVQKLAATSGSPISYVPPPPPVSSLSTSPTKPSGINGEVRGVNKRIIIGVSVGVGVPVLAAIIAGCL
ncbi:hypothetical protein AOQ84DRAFT_416306 [Glonium stellatum]|uniref:Uncharacterized protein n=1 Tax=Glonium stellatum TaxID=574774 RepID=A0A8E2JP69_9PEZI|nr:hypothetical protein AOQ84DRAFT_416306 [Glonium stellatum]